MADYVFFSMNNFETEGGGTIRMYGILNTLSEQGNKVILISNVKDYSKFDKNIKHILIDIDFTPVQKRLFQFQLSLFSPKIVNIQFENLLKRLTKIFSEVQSEKVYFFEYLDNSIGYWLKRNKVILSYVNDLHGIATSEFDFQRKNKKGVYDTLLFNLKYVIAKKLDRKVIGGSQLNIFLSKKMKEYYVDLYPQIELIPFLIIPNLLPYGAESRKVDNITLEKLKIKYSITKKDVVILFAGAFKLTGGVLDLIKAFEKLNIKSQRIKLLLVGDGYEKKNCELYVEKNNLKDKVIFVGRTPYSDLPTYQQLADILVCPDKQNLFSNVIIHIKYLDCLLANKVVINGSFDSVKEVNENEKLSLNFIPSDINDLSRVLAETINNYDFYKEKYNATKEYALAHLTYSTNVSQLN